MLGGQFATHDGGKGANQAVAAARMGARVSMIGAVGADALRRARGCLAGGRGHRHVAHPAPRRGATGVAIIAVGPRGENQIVVAPGANALLELDVEDRALIGAADVVLTNHEIPPSATVDALRTAHAAGVTAILNPAPARALLSEVLSLGPILTPNEHELVVAIGNDVTDTALDELAARTAGRSSLPRARQVPCWPRAIRANGSQARLAPQVVDTTGAGDTFCGVLAAWLAAGAACRGDRGRQRGGCRFSWRARRTDRDADPRGPPELPARDIRALGSSRGWPGTPCALGDPANQSPP